MESPTPYPQQPRTSPQEVNDSPGIPAELHEEAIRSARAPHADSCGLPGRVVDEVLPVLRSLAFHLTILFVGYASVCFVAPGLLAPAGPAEDLAVSTLDADVFPLAGGLEQRKEVSSAHRESRAEREAVGVMRTADIHESERGSGRGTGEVLSVAVAANDRGSGRCGFAAWRNPAAPEWQ